MWHLAQLNIATARYDLDDPRMEGFVGRLDAVNAMADAAPGFVWRLQSGSGNATGIKVSDDPRLIVNMSVWESPDTLFRFVYRTGHRDVMVRRRDWFRKPDGPYQVLWWIEAGRLPTAEDGMSRLAHLERHGPTPKAFTFKRRFPPPGVAGDPKDMQAEPNCVGWR